MELQPRALVELSRTNSILDIDALPSEAENSTDSFAPEENDMIMREVHDWLEVNQWDSHWSLRQYHLSTACNPISRLTVRSTNTTGSHKSSDQTK